MREGNWWDIAGMKSSLFACFFTVASLTAFGWGQTGHRAVGLIADRNLTKKARKEVSRILKGESVAMVSTWMDDLYSDSTYNYADDWHWVTIPDGQTYETSEKNPNGDVIVTIERLISELKSGKFSGRDELERLKMLIHLVGDIHQPLHVGRPDKGGNSIRVMWFRSDSNLHRVWDSDMIDGKDLSYTEFADWLGNPSTADKVAWEKSTVREWAMESVSYRPQVYNYGEGKLGFRYSYENFHIVKLRIQQGGIRLAAVLNAIYG